MAHIEAILWQVKINCEFSKWQIIFDDTSTTFGNSVTCTIFWQTWFRALLTPIFKKDGFYQQTQHGNMEMTKSEKLLKKTKKQFSGIFFDILPSKKGHGSGLS